jgi:hypothetical protein
MKEIVLGEGYLHSISLAKHPVHPDWKTQCPVFDKKGFCNCDVSVRVPRKKVRLIAQVIPDVGRN